MRCVYIREPGGPDVLQVVNAPIPEPGDHDVLIRVTAAGLNGADLLQRAGKYPPPPDASPIPGLEVSGQIEKLGSGVKGWNVGDAVCALVNGGGYAEYVSAPASQCLPIPRGVTLEQAGGLPETAFTVWTNLFDRGRLKAGETVLIHGGAGGIGSMAIQLSHAMGARVFATAGSREKCDFCRSAGAELAIDHRRQDFVTEVLDATGQRGVDVILDVVGADYAARNLKALALEGRLIQVSVISGSKAEIDLRTIMSKCATLTGSTLRPRTIEQKAGIAASVRRSVWPLIEKGQIKPVTDRVFPLAEVAAAHRYMEKAEHIGKVLLSLV